MARSSGARKRTCSTCGEPTEAIYNLCGPCLHAEVLATRAAHGLPPTVEDPETRQRVAS